MATITPIARSHGRGWYRRARRRDASATARSAVRAGTSERASSGERSLVEQIRDQLRSTQDLGAALSKVASSVLETQRFRTVAIAEWRGGQVLPHVLVGVAPAPDWLEHADTNLIAVCIREGRPVEVPTALTPDARGQRPPATLTVYAPIGPFHRPWGVVIVESASDRPLSRQDLDLLESLCSAVEVMSAQEALVDRVQAQQRRSDGLAAITVADSAPSWSCPR